MTDLLWQRAGKGSPVLLLAHGAGAPMDSDFMQRMTSLLNSAGISVARFEFPYMAARRTGGSKRPPDRAPVLLESFSNAAERVGGLRDIFIGGKSMGGRMATLLAAKAPCRGVVCFGYPFHPPGKPEKVRTAHLADLSVPTLICQGERDPFGRRDEVERYNLSATTSVYWCADGNHDLMPRKASGHSHTENLQQAALFTKNWIEAQQ